VAVHEQRNPAGSGEEEFESTRHGSRASRARGVEFVDVNKTSAATRARGLNPVAAREQDLDDPMSWAIRYGKSVASSTSSAALPDSGEVIVTARRFPACASELFETRKKFGCCPDAGAVRS